MWAGPQSKASPRKWSWTLGSGEKRSWKGCSLKGQNVFLSNRFCRFLKKRKIALPGVFRKDLGEEKVTQFWHFGKSGIRGNRVAKDWLKEMSYWRERRWGPNVPPSSTQGHTESLSCPRDHLYAPDTQWISPEACPWGAHFPVGKQTNRLTGNLTMA